MNKLVLLMLVGLVGCSHAAPDLDQLLRSAYYRGCRDAAKTSIAAPKKADPRASIENECLARMKKFDLKELPNYQENLKVVFESEKNVK